MAHFVANPVSTTGVSILTQAGLTAAAGKQAKFLWLGFSNDSAAQVTLTIFDGTAIANVPRLKISLAVGASKIIRNENAAGHAVLPKKWFTANTAVECNCSSSNSIQVFGEIILE